MKYSKQVVPSNTSIFGLWHVELLFRSGSERSFVAIKQITMTIIDDSLSKWNKFYFMIIIEMNNTYGCTRLCFLLVNGGCSLNGKKTGSSNLQIILHFHSRLLRNRTHSSAVFWLLDNRALFLMPLKKCVLCSLIQFLYSWSYNT